MFPSRFQRLWFSFRGQLLTFVWWFKRKLRLEAVQKTLLHLSWHFGKLHQLFGRGMEYRLESLCKILHQVTIHRIALSIYRSNHLYVIKELLEQKIKEIRLNQKDPWLQVQSRSAWYCHLHQSRCFMVWCLGGKYHSHDKSLEP